MIQLKNVHKAFGPKRVLDGFTLDVPEGQTMVIIGYSGTGKSVLATDVTLILTTAGATCAARSANDGKAPFCDGDPMAVSVACASGL